MNEWFYLPFTVGKYGDAEIFIEEGITFIGNKDNRYWMSNSPFLQYGIQGQRSMLHYAKGKVLCCLGLGLLPLLCALKDEVSEVVAIDIDPDIIEAFNSQGFDTSKITVLNKDMLSFDSVKEFDTILLDAAPVQYEFIEKYSHELKGKAVLMQGWEDDYINWLKSSSYLGEVSINSLNAFGETRFMPKMTEQDLQDYLFTYYAKMQKLYRTPINENETKWVDVLASVDIPLDFNLIQSLKLIQEKRMEKLNE